MLIPTKVLKSASATCDTKAARFALGGVQVERENGKPLALSTDGYAMTIIRWDEESASDYPAVNGYSRDTQPDFMALVPQADWLAAAKMAPKRPLRKILSNVLLTEDKAPQVDKATKSDPTYRPYRDNVIFAAADGNSHSSSHVKCLEGRFPQWRDVVPEYRLPTDEQVKQTTDTFNAVQVTLDPHKVITLMKSAIDAGLQGVTLEVPLVEGGAVNMSGKHEGVDWRALLMPRCR